MNSRFVIPAAVAMALHAILFLGFPPANPPVIVGGSHLKVDPIPSPTVLAVVEWLATPDDPPAATPPGVTHDSPPELPEPPVDVTHPTVEMPSTPPSPRPNPTTTTTRIELFGDLDSPPRIDRNGPVSFVGLDNPPRTRTQIAPVYPYEARVSGKPGEVMVEFVVDETGRVLDPHVLHSSDALFEAPTLRAISKWRFEPGRRGGQIVRFRMAVPVAFAVNP